MYTVILTLLLLVCFELFYENNSILCQINQFLHRSRRTLKQSSHVLYCFDERLIACIPSLNLFITCALRIVELLV